MFARLLVALVVRAVAALLTAERYEVDRVATAAAAGYGVATVAGVLYLVAALAVEGESA
jgi:hypothetical protein